jgi:hypothetical protein
MELLAWERMICSSPDIRQAGCNLVGCAAVLPLLVPFHGVLSELSLRARSVQCHRKALAQQLYKLRRGR